MAFLPITPFKRFFLLFLLVSAVFLRLYNLSGSLQFQGDQGRDSMIVADIFRKHDLVFIGPVTSVGNMYLGPLYYYFMLPFLWLTYPSPMGPVYAVAILGIITVYLVYRIGKELVGEKAALIATFFYTFSATITQATRFSWNPNPAPLVSLFMIFFTYKAWKEKPSYWIWVSLCFSILLQLHYLTLLALPAAGLIWLFSAREYWVNWRKSLAKLKNPSFLVSFKSFWNEYAPLLKPTLLAAVIFLISLTPLILFDLKHQGSNFKAFQSLLTNEDTFTTAAPTSTLTKITTTLKENEGRGMHILFEIMIGKNRPLNQFSLWVVALSVLGFVISQLRKKKDISKLIVLFLFLGIGILGTSFYEHSIFDHYIAYLFPVTALVYGWFFSSIRPKFLSWIIFGIFSIYFLWYNVGRFPLKSMGWTLADIQRTSETLLQHVRPGEKYNIVLLSESRDIDGQNYRYFLTTGHTAPVPVEERNNVEALFVINEEKKITTIVDSPIYEIVVFPNKTPVNVFSIQNGPEITVLRRTTQDPTQGIQ